LSPQVSKLLISKKNTQQMKMQRRMEAAEYDGCDLLYVYYNFRTFSTRRTIVAIPKNTAILSCESLALAPVLPC
jgi:hypothetical protein